jgi:hypothetical protein
MQVVQDDKENTARDSAGLISARLFTYIVSCLRLLMEHRGGRLAKALNTVLLHLLLRIGAWC